MDGDTARRLHGEQTDIFGSNGDRRTEPCPQAISCINAAPIRSSAQSTWSLVITSGGAMRMVC